METDHYAVRVPLPDFDPPILASPLIQGRIKFLRRITIGPDKRVAEVRLTACMSCRAST